MKTDNRKARSMMLRVLARLAYEVDATPEDLTAALGFDVSEAWSAAGAAGYIADGSVTPAGAKHLDYALIYRPGRPGRPPSLDPDTVALLRADGLGGRTLKEWAMRLEVTPATLRRALYGVDRKESP
jgi:hypothetical protein